MSMTCGEATMRLLARYGVTTVFGIPGVHTLDLCRGLSGGGDAGAIRHVQARNEQGAGFMAEGWARATGEVGVAVVISGPGVTNATTALGQCYADSLPMLLISAEPESRTLGKGRGALHEITEQKKVTEPLTALSVTVRTAADVPEFMARAFVIFASQRPRPVHISIPLDVQAEVVEEDWRPVALPSRPGANASQIKEAADLLLGAERPLIMMGGGAGLAGSAIAKVAQRLGAGIVSSTAGKGIVPDIHPLHLSAGTVRPEGQAFISKADVILAVGTELSDTDSFVTKLSFNGRIIRIDIDTRKISDQYPAALGIIADAADAMEQLAGVLAHADAKDRREATAQEISAIRQSFRQDVGASERQHIRLLDLIRRLAPTETIFSGDACQIVYTSTFALDLPGPRQFFYPVGFCALGCGLPNAIGAKLAWPDVPVVALAGDGGVMFTVQELVTAAELCLPLPIVIWENDGLKQIRDDMDLRDIPRVGVDGINPDFVALARACRCDGVYADSEESFTNAFTSALTSERPTLIVVKENDSWLLS